MDKPLVISKFPHFPTLLYVMEADVNPAMQGGVVATTITADREKPTDLEDSDIVGIYELASVNRVRIKKGVILEKL